MQLSQQMLFRLSLLPKLEKLDDVQTVELIQLRDEAGKKRSIGNHSEKVEKIDDEKIEPILLKTDEHKFENTNVLESQ